MRISEIAFNLPEDAPTGNYAAINIDAAQKAFDCIKNMLTPEQYELLKNNHQFMLYGEEYAGEL